MKHISEFLDFFKPKPKVPYSALVSDTKNQTYPDHQHTKDVIELDKLNVDLARVTQKEGIPQSNLHEKNHNKVAEHRRSWDYKALVHITKNTIDERISNLREEEFTAYENTEHFQGLYDDLIHIPLDKEQLEELRKINEDAYQTYLAAQKKKGHFDRITAKETQKRETFSDARLTEEQHQLEDITQSYHEACNQNHPTHAEFIAGNQTLQDHKRKQTALGLREQQLHKRIETIHQYPKNTNSNSTGTNTPAVSNYQAGIVKSWINDGLDKTREELESEKQPNRKVDTNRIYFLKEKIKIFRFPNRPLNWLAHMGLLGMILSFVGVCITTIVDYASYRLLFHEILGTTAAEAAIAGLIGFSLGKFLSYTIYLHLKNLMLRLRPSLVWITMLITAIIILTNAFATGWLVISYREEGKLTGFKIQLEQSILANDLQIQRTKSPTLKKTLEQDSKFKTEELSNTKQRLRYYHSRAYSDLQKKIIGALTVLSLLVSAWLMTIGLLIWKKIKTKKQLGKWKSTHDKMVAQFNYYVKFIKENFTSQVLALECQTHSNIKKYSITF